MDTSVCLHPVWLPDKGWVPCGKCPVCRMKYRKQMAIRIKMEQNIDKPLYSYFITLTYNEDSIPKFNGRDCFSKKHITTFLDSLKHRLSRDGYSYRYFFTCEYGEEGYRPHYHAILFLYGRISDSGRVARVHYPLLTPGLSAPHFFFNDCIVQPLWPFGFTYQGTVSSASVLYCTSYALKDDELLTRDWKGFEPGKPFRRYSLKPGLGLTDKCCDWFYNYIINDEKEYRTSISINAQRGRVSSGIPVAIKKRLKDNYPDKYESFKMANSAFMAEALPKLERSAFSYGPTKIYGRIGENGYFPDSFPAFDSSVDKEVIAFRKALRKMNKHAKRL